MKGRGLTFIAALIALGAGLTAWTLMPSTKAQGLIVVTGETERCGDGFCVSNRRIDFGDLTRLETEESPVDHNRDGVIGTRFDELVGLVGQHVIVEIDRHGRVTTLNGIPWRHNYGRSPTTSPTTTSPLSTAPPTTAPPTPTTQPQQETTRRGVLVRCGPSFCVDDTRIYFGPWWFLTSRQSPVDLNGDGVRAITLEEIESLLGETVEVGVKSEPSDTAVLTINGIQWRNAVGPPPWAGGP